MVCKLPMDGAILEATSQLRHGEGIAFDIFHAKHVFEAEFSHGLMSGLAWDITKTQ